MEASFLASGTAVKFAAKAAGNVTAPVLAITTPKTATPIAATQRGGAFVAAIGDTLVGDHQTKAIAPGMTLRHNGEALSVTDYAARLETPSDTVVVMLHGLGCTERNRGSEVLDAVELDASPVLIRYTTGVSIADNGSALASLLDQLSRNWPTPVKRIVLLGHSMGGLVARRALELTERAHELVTDLITLGSPHGGSPVEKGAHWALTGLSKLRTAAPLAELGHRRSRGIEDLRYGAIRPEDWGGRDPDSVLADETQDRPLPSGVHHDAVIASWSHDPGGWLSWLVGDGIVRHKSAEPIYPTPAESEVPAVTVLAASSHLSMLKHPEVGGIVAETIATDRSN